MIIKRQSAPIYLADSSKVSMLKFTSPAEGATDSGPKDNKSKKVRQQHFCQSKNRCSFVLHLPAILFNLPICISKRFTNFCQNKDTKKSKIGNDRKWTELKMHSPLRFTAWFAWASASELNSLKMIKMYYFAFRERVAENKNNVYKKSRKIISIALLSKY